MEIEEDDEAVEHLLSFCPRLTEKRRLVLGRELVDWLEQLADVDIVRLENFAQAWKCVRAEIRRN